MNFIFLIIFLTNLMAKEMIEFENSFGLKLSSSTYEYFLYENRPSAKTPGLFYFLDAQMNFKPLSQLLANLKVYAKNQFDQQNRIKKNMAFQYIQAGLKLDQPMSLFNEFWNIGIDTNYQIQWRSIGGNPSSIYLAYYQFNPFIQWNTHADHIISIHADYLKTSNYYNDPATIIGGMIKYTFYQETNFILMLHKTNIHLLKELEISHLFSKEFKIDITGYNYSSKIFGIKTNTTYTFFINKNWLCLNSFLFTYDKNLMDFQYSLDFKIFY